jgi:hypothetical protein
MMRQFLNSTMRAARPIYLPRFDLNTCIQRLLDMIEVQLYILWHDARKPK